MRLPGVNFLATGLAEYRTFRWGMDAPSPGHDAPERASRPPMPHGTKSAFAAATRRERLLRRRDWEADMLAWLLWRLERIERVHAVAGMPWPACSCASLASRPAERRAGGNDRPIAPERRESGDASHRSSPAGVRSPPRSTPQPARHCWNLIRSPTRRGSPRAGRRRSGSNLFAERMIVARRI